jgi:glycosyltransferase involved in cell wall biosynthesis
MIDPKDKKVLIVTEVFSPEDFLINDLVFTWKNQGYDVSVLTRNPSYPAGTIFPGYRNPLFQKEVVNGVPVSRVQFIPGYKSSKFLKVLNYLWNMKLAWIWVILNGRRFDSIYICQTGPLTFSSAGALIHKLYGTKTTIWVQDVWPETVFAYGLAKKGLSRAILERFVKWVYSGCDTITVTSPGFIPLIGKHCPTKKIEFIPQWSLTTRYSGDIGDGTDIIYPGKFNFVFAGNIGKVQNLENVLRGFDRFIKMTGAKETWLNLIGDGSHLEYLRDLVQNNNFENINFRGRVKSSEMPVFYEKADVLLIALENTPIFNVTIPAKFQSCLNAEKPLFGIISGEVAHLITSHDLGWVATPDDIQEIATTFGAISSADPLELREKTKNTTVLLTQQFSRNKAIQRITDLVFNQSN